jgi:hypothetical protein
VSLIGFVKSREGRHFFASEFTKPRIKILGELKAPPLTTHYSLVGTAFDYLIRFCLKYRYPNAKDNHWVADFGNDTILRIKSPRSPMAIFHKKRIENVKFAKETYSQFLKNGVLTEDIFKSSILLAQIDPVRRALAFDKQIGLVDNNDIQDLKNLINLVNFENFKPASYCLLNPTFNEGSKLVGGGDTDIVIDNQIIDIKTTRKLEVTRDMFNQIIGYYILGEIGGIGKEKINIPNINEIGFYFSRYGIKFMYKVEDIIDFNFLSNFIEKFKKCFENEPIEIGKRILEIERLSCEKQIPWNKGLEGVQVPWNKGLKGVQVPWNKGLEGVQVPWNKGLKRVHRSKL